MTKSELIEAIKDFPDNIPVQVEFGIDHHVPIERVQKYHPDDADSRNENYLLIILG